MFAHHINILNHYIFPGCSQEFYTIYLYIYSILYKGGNIILLMQVSLFWWYIFEC